VLLALLVGAFGTSGLGAQESPQLSYLFKVRMGLLSGDLQKSHFDNKLMGFGAEAKYSLGPIGSVLAELAWEYVPGRHHDIYPWDTNPLNLSPRYSYDDRKEYGAGLNLRLGYAAPMPAFGPAPVADFLKNMEWFAGLGVDMFQVRSEVKYTLNFTPTTNNPPSDQIDGGNFTEQKTQLVPGIFAGVKYSFSKDIGFELSFRNFGMWHYDFTPAGYYSTNPLDFGTGKASTGTSRGTAIEFAITAKL
jgi:hypothetical protein